MMVVRVWAVLLLVAAVAPLHAQLGFRRAPRSVTFDTAEGRPVRGWLLAPQARPAPAVVLVPMLGRSKEEWQPAAERLAEAGLVVLAIDLPGRGGQGADLAAWRADVTAAVGFLAGREEVEAAAIGVAGASLGASLAVLAAADDPRIRSLALISPALDYQGVRIEAAWRQYGERPALLLASRRDPYAARTARTLAEGNGVRELHWSDVPAHGLTLLSEPELTRNLVDWFRRTLAVH